MKNFMERFNKFMDWTTDRDTPQWIMLFVAILFASACVVGIYGILWLIVTINIPVMFIFGVLTGLVIALLFRVKEVYTQNPPSESADVREGG